MRILLTLLLTFLCSTAGAVSNFSPICGATTPITTTGTRTPVGGTGHEAPRTFVGTMTVTSGSGSATILIEGNMGSLAKWTTVATLSITDTTDAAVTDYASNFAQYRCNVTAISGTGAAAMVTMGSKSP